MFCDENHSANRCVKTTGPHARKRFLSSKGHSFFCFEKSHVASSCKLNYKCSKCNGHHHISICTFSKLKNSSQTPQNGQSQNSQSAPVTPDQDFTSNIFSNNTNNILMQTATASVSNLEKNSVTTDGQIIFDRGSQRTYLNEALCERLKFPVIRSKRIIVKTFGNNEYQARDFNIVLIKFCAVHKNASVEAICSQVIFANLTNQNCNCLDYYFEFIRGEVMKGIFGEPVDLKPSFGYILSGQYKSHSTLISMKLFLNIHTKTDVSFWQQYFDTNVKYLFNEAYCHESMKERSYLISEFQNNLKHNGSRYEVKLHFIGENETLPDNYLLAKTRTENLLKQLAKDAALLKNYDTILKEYLQKRIIEKASDIPNEGYIHYLPHRPVIGNDRESSKIRGGFEASARFKIEKSLNDFLDPGPCLLPFLFNILLHYLD